MKPSLRFLALVAIGWAGVRAATLGVIPGAEVFRVNRSEARSPPPLIATEFPPIDPLPTTSDAYPPDYQQADYPAAPMPPPPGPSYAVYYQPAPASPMAGPTRLAGALPTPRPGPTFYSPIPALDDWPVSRVAATWVPQRRSSVVIANQSTPAMAAAVKPGIDRVQLSAWALLRGRQVALGPSGIATGGTLGGSQAGARLTYNFTRRIAATMRTSSDVGRRGGEVALGARVQPVTGIPIWINAERRQRIGKLGGGRNAFAMFFEGEVYDRPMPLQLRLDAYLQAGVVGFNKRDRFIDGAMTLNRPLYRNFTGGAGVWGGAQPGVYRVDAGPRLSYRVRDNIKVHLDYRQRLAGKAEPGSGPVVTLAADF
ncbi:MAG: hypothetical protein ABIO68_03000 [Sphingomicrobium sp.]